MVLISSKKYACETCIKGHRSSACKHTDRPLFEIKKKGRPVTQCEHCRELRKTKQVHVKCICEAKEPPSPTAPKKKGDPHAGTPTLPAHAAFPHGVPEGSGSTTSDSDHGGSSLLSASAKGLGCTCKVFGGECHCCTPRIRPGRRRSEPAPAAPQMTPINTIASNSTSPSPTLPSSSNLSINPNAHSHCNPSPLLPTTPNPSPDPNSSGNAAPSMPAPPSRTPSHHILARIAELRPVLPRLSARDAALMQGATGQHDLFHHAPGHPHHPSHACHGEHFSPYGRAYDYALHAEFHSDASTSSASGFYQQDARSAESLLSIGSLASVGTSASQRSAPPGAGHRSQNSIGHKSVSQKSHSQKSPSYDGQPQGHPFFGATPSEVEWRLPPSLSRSSTTEVYPNRRSASSNTDERMGYAGRLTSDAPASAASANTPPPFAPRPRSEAAAAVGGSSNLDLTNAVFAPRPRSEAAADFSGGGNSFLRPRSSDGPFLGSGGGNAGAAVRTCGCGAGCACPGCALHGVPVSSASVGGSQNVGASQSGQNQNGERHCADAACGGACLDCSILGLEDFSSVVGFGSGGAAEGGGAGYPNSSASGKGEILNKEGEYQFDALALEEYAAGAGDLDLDLDLEGLEVYNAELEGYDLGQDAFEQARQSAAIDEWIREVGALPPPPPPVGPPFEFEGFDTSANANNMKVEFDVGGGMDFGAGDDAQFGNAGQWVFDVDAGSDGRMEGLTSADVTFPCTDSHAFLTVPGPGAHVRSRSSSSASSEVSVPGAGAGAGAGGMGAGSASLGVAPAHPHPHPLHAPGAMVLDPPAAVPALLFPPPLPAAYLDEQMLFF